jgi:hypothetical protein
MSDFVVVSPVKGLSKVPAYLGDRLNGYVTVFLPVGTVVTDVKKFPYELKKYWGNVEGVQHVFWKDSLKRKPAKKRSEEEE